MIDSFSFFIFIAAVHHNSSSFTSFIAIYILEPGRYINWSILSSDTGLSCHCICFTILDDMKLFGFTDHDAE